MKKIINMSLMLALFTVLTICFTACSNDDDDKLPAPQITLNEANIEGDILCVQADVIAKGRTSAILLTITGKDGSTKVTYPVTDSKYIGVLNIDGFHVHVDINGKNVEEGDLLKMTVTDAEGQSVTAQKDITAEEEDEDE
ncbi:MAG: hypothetical protein K6F22_05060 [Prevotella sp.]|jgi:hypothetical protein|nr:hypothetical protein [Prevotella sp.]